MASDKILVLTDSNFKETLEKSSTPLVIDFWAEWCGPCKMVAPSVEELAEELKGKIQFAKMDVDSNQQVPMQFAVRSIPTFAVFDKGNLCGKFTGAMAKDQLKKEIFRYLPESAQ